MGKQGEVVKVWIAAEKRGMRLLCSYSEAETIKLASLYLDGADIRHESYYFTNNELRYLENNSYIITIQGD